MKLQNGRSLTQFVVLMVALILIAGVATYVVLDSELFSDDNNNQVIENRSTNEIN